MNSLVRISAQLPQLAVQLPPQDAVGLDLDLLIPHVAGETVEAAIAQFRTTHAAERCRLFCRYYIASRREGRVTLKYVINSKRPNQDRVVGTCPDTLEAMKVLIGNWAASRCMTSVRWELCDDRDGVEVIDVGRFDYWSLLGQATTTALQQLAATGLAPIMEKWDFDKFMWWTQCQNCKARVAVNAYAFNPDSGRCSKCQTRPFLSGGMNGWLLQLLDETEQAGQPEVTGVDEGALAPLVQSPSLEGQIIHAFQWMASVGAKAAEVHLEGQSAADVFRRLGERSVIHRLAAQTAETAELATTAGGMTLLAAARELAPVFAGQVAPTREHQVLFSFVQDMLRHL